MTTASGTWSPGRVGFGVLVALELVAGAAAVVVGLFLVAVPDGALWLDPALLRGSPFDDWRVPGILLADVVGGGLLVAGMWARTTGAAR